MSQPNGSSPGTGRVEAPASLSVSELNRQVRILLESHHDYLWVTGEISNFARPASGHWYFTLKDASAQVRCAMFRARNAQVRFRPRDGDAVRLRCRVSLYEARGEFQLIGENMEPAGAGLLQARFEALRARLLQEGLFDAERKRPLPAEVSHLGVITSATGAALQDILTVLKRRCPLIRVSVLPVPVQGAEAAPALCAALARANRWQQEGRLHFDALIVGRGGGSLEDLWAFNEESVARAIAASDIPVVSAVGHEVDISIADLVADARAPTPSAAAEMLSPDQADWLAQLAAGEQRLAQGMRRRLAYWQRELAHRQQRLRHPGSVLRERAQRLDELEQRLLRAQRQQDRLRRARLEQLQQRLLRHSPLARLRAASRALPASEARLQQAMQARLTARQRQLARLADLLNSLSPLATLQRGYSILRDTTGSVVRSEGQVSTGDALEATLASGTLRLRVEDTGGAS